ncbi:hypothetical protein [Arcticibacterium luteifluviistationis]|uniref:Uncharacterized protein n=1 Tax=Arcticibacterium luteifluviistationis TaxID=1784714 RepID=A0A2Z4G9J8_9BACT|nr:hypothetical protein [Arcticibacterium luteifluviistationis]AWV97902.1 hypothetical protein DJ013_06865 [Arcticibacterium luteifluviistationis]
MIKKILLFLLISTLGFSQLKLKVPGTNVNITPSSTFTSIDNLTNEIKKANNSINTYTFFDIFYKEDIPHFFHLKKNLEISIGNGLCFQITRQSILQLVDKKLEITEFIKEPYNKPLKEKIVISKLKKDLYLRYGEKDYKLNSDYPEIKLILNNTFSYLLHVKINKHYSEKQGFINDIVSKDSDPNLEEITRQLFRLDSTISYNPKLTYKAGEIRKENYKNQFIAQYYNESYNKHYRGIRTDSLQGLNSLMDSLNKYLVRDYYGNITKDTVKDCGCKNLKFLRKNSFIFSDVKLLWESVSKNNRDWVRDWLWYTKGKPTLNPLGITESLKDSIPVLTRRINDNEKLIELIQNAVKSNSPLSSNISGDYKKTLKKISNDKLFLEYLNKLGNNELASDELLYKFELPKISLDTILFWYDHYDASKSFEFINSNSKPKKFREPFSIYAKDENIVAVHNIPHTMVVDLNATEEKVEVLSRIETEFTTPLAKEFISNTLIGRGLNYVKKAIEKSKAPPSSKCNDFYNPDSITSSVCNGDSLEALEGLITKYDNAVAILSWLNEQTVPTPQLKLIKDNTPAFRTEYLYPERKLKLDSDREISYNLITNAKKDSLVASKKYIKYNKVHFLPFAGLAYLPTQRVNVDYIEGKLVNTEEFNNAVDFYAGVKWYPWGINRSWDSKTSKFLRKTFDKKVKICKKRYINSIRGRGNLALERVSFSLGLGVNQEFLNNYFFGVGWDPVPGLNLQIGSNLYFQRTLDFKNGTQVHKGHNPRLIGPYYAITVDLGIANNLISIFKR